MPAYLARIGLSVFAMLFAIALLTEREAAGRALTVPPADVAMPAVFAVDRPVAVAGFQAMPAVAPLAPAVAPLAPAVAAPAAVTPVNIPVAPAVTSDAVVLASWYGPGFYGNRTACGQIYTPQLSGVAHKTLPCGTRLTLTYGARSVEVAVIDRGPYVAGRTLDLSNATKLALGCTDLCTLRMQVH
jgi:rare lipoprotein A (peptidoglycan hydrolase)